MSVAKAKRTLEVQLFMVLNNPSFRLMENSEDPSGADVERVKERLRGLVDDLAVAERIAEELFALGFRGSAGLALNTSVAGAHYAIKRPVEDLPVEPEWSSIRRALLEVDVLLDISLDEFRSKRRVRCRRGRSREDEFRDYRIAEVSEKRRAFVNEQHKRIDVELKEFLSDP